MCCTGKARVCGVLGRLGHVVYWGIRACGVLGKVRACGVLGRLGHGCTGEG